MARRNSIESKDPERASNALDAVTDPFATIRQAAWIREEVRGPRALSGTPDDGERKSMEASIHRRVRAIFALQTLLAAFFSIMALFVFELDWRSIASDIVIVLGGIASAVIGVVGCALAISSRINERWLNVLVRQIH